MMQFFTIEPEVAGGLGPGTIIDRTVHPAKVTKLEYIFDGWLGDEIIESFRCVLVTEGLWNRLSDMHCSGIERGEVKVSTSPEFSALHPDIRLPAFVWLRVIGESGMDDFGNAKDGSLVVSERALRSLLATKPRALDVEPFPKIEDGTK